MAPRSACPGPDDPGRASLHSLRNLSGLAAPSADSATIPAARLEHCRQVDRQGTAAAGRTAGARRDTAPLREPQLSAASCGSRRLSAAHPRPRRHPVRTVWLSCGPRQIPVTPLVRRFMRDLLRTAAVRGLPHDGACSGPPATMETQFLPAALRIPRAISSPMPNAVAPGCSSAR